MRFLGSKFTRNALAVGAPPRTPLGELKRSPRPSSRFQGGRFAAGEREGREKREEGEGKGKEEGKGREEGREGKERRRERGRGSLRHWCWGG